MIHRGATKKQTTVLLASESARAQAAGRWGLLAECCSGFRTTLARRPVGGPARSMGAPALRWFPHLREEPGRDCTGKVLETSFAAR